MLNIIVLIGLLFLFSKLYNYNPDLPFGSELGTIDNVPAYSSYYNKNYPKPSSYFHNNYVNGTFSGFKWQCVEYARRYLIINNSITFKQIDNAYQIFDLNNFFSITDNRIVPIKKCLNGSNIAPKKGSLLIWKPKKNDNITGHVAIITKVNLNDIEIAEQNICNKKWSNNYSRTFKFKYNNGYHIMDDHIIGWINII